MCTGYYLANLKTWICQSYIFFFITWFFLIVTDRRHQVMWQVGQRDGARRRRPFWTGAEKKRIKAEELITIVERWLTERGTRA